MQRRITIVGAGLAALLFCGLHAAPGRAEESVVLPPVRVAPSVPSLEDDPPSRSAWIHAIDRLHARCCRYVIAFGQDVDFALSERLREPVRRARDPGRIEPLLDERSSVIENRGSRIKLSPQMNLRDADGLEVKLRANGKLSLPRFEDRLSLVFSSTDEGESVLEDLQRETLSREDRPREESAGLRYYLKESLNFRASVDAGLRFRPEPDPRLRLRLGLSEDVGDYLARLTQTFFWEAHDGVGEKTQIDLEETVPHRYLRRWTASLLWSEEDDVEGGLSYSHYLYLSRRRVAGVKVGLTSKLEPEARMENYTARLLYRQRLHRDWLFLEIEPGVEFPRERDFQATGFLNVKLDIIFGDWQERDAPQG